MQAEPIQSALKATRDDARARRERLYWTGITAASYAVDTLFLGLFALAGIIPGTISLGYGIAAMVICGASALAQLKGWNLRARDPGLTEPLILIALSLQLAVVWFAPQIAFPYLCNIFTVLAFGVLALTVRESLVIWGLAAAGTGTVLYAVSERLGMPTTTGFGLTLVWLYFSVIMGRFILLSVYSTGLRARLGESRRRLAATLDQVQRLISHDELTRTLNRRSLVTRLGEERSRCERSGASFSLALMDLDHFKHVNDSYGHDVGDAVLRGFAAAVHDAMRVTDVFGRYGGEEFLLILTGSSAEAARDAAERIRTAVMAKDWSVTAAGLKVTVSVGIAAFRKGESIEQLLKRADNALYQAKHAGRNRIVSDQT